MDINCDKCPNCAGQLITDMVQMKKICRFCDSEFFIDGQQKAKPPDKNNNMGSAYKKYSVYIDKFDFKKDFDSIKCKYWLIVGFSYYGIEGVEIMNKSEKKLKAYLPGLFIPGLPLGVAKKESIFNNSGMETRIVEECKASSERKYSLIVENTVPEKNIEFIAEQYRNLTQCEQEEAEMLARSLPGTFIKGLYRGYAESYLATIKEKCPDIEIKITEDPAESINSKFSIRVENTDMKMSLIKAYGSITGQNLRESRNMIESMPGVLFSGLSEKTAIRYMNVFRDEKIYNGIIMEEE